MFVDRVRPVRGALAEAVQAIKKSQKLHYQWDSVFIELFVCRCDLDVSPLCDIGVQKRGVAV